MSTYRNRQLAIASGARTYQGAPCKRGHLGIRHTRNANCIECEKFHTDKANKSERMRKWRNKNADKVKQKQTYAYIYRTYGLTQSAYDDMLAGQDYKCKVCGRSHTDNTYERLCVDHCHSTGKIRGLLCNKCNTALGLMQDSPERLRLAAAYLENT